MSRVNFQGALLDKSNFEKSTLKESDFTDTNLTEASFAHAVLESVKLGRSNLNKADFLNAEFITPYLYATELAGAKNIEHVFWLYGFVVGEEADGDYDKPLDVYKRLINLYESKGSNEVVDNFKQRKNLVLAENSAFPLNIIRMLFGIGQTGIGIPPLLLLLSVVPIIIIFTSAYLIFSSLQNLRSGIYTIVIKNDSDRIKKRVLPLETRGFWLVLDCLIFSAVSFVSFGYSTIFRRCSFSLYGLLSFNYRAVGYVKLLSGLVAVIGICITALLIFTLI